MAKRGRPSSFDREKALQSALELFWARGYDGATLEDLQEAMGGISPPSFYNAFGSKEKLFQEATDLYLATVSGPLLRGLEGAKTAREGVEAMLRLTVENVLCRGKPRGCLLLSTTRCTSDNKGAHDYLLAFRRRSPKIFKDRLDRGVQEGDLPPATDTTAMASFYVTVSQGIGLRASDGASRRDLNAVVDGAMAAWDQLAG